VLLGEMSPYEIRERPPVQKRGPFGRPREEVELEFWPRMFALKASDRRINVKTVRGRKKEAGLFFVWSDDGAKNRSEGRLRAPRPFCWAWTPCGGGRRALFPWQLHCLCILPGGGFGRKSRSVKEMYD